MAYTLDPHYSAPQYSMDSGGLQHGPQYFREVVLNGSGSESKSEQ